MARTEIDPLPERVRSYLLGFSWIEDAQVRMREEGHVYFGEAFVVLRERKLAERLQAAGQGCKALDWRVHDLVIVPVSSLPEPGTDPGRFE